MSEVTTHEAFGRALESLEGDATDWRRRLPEACVSHAEACSGCLRLAEALALFSECADEVLGEAPPDSYWDDFQSRLDGRLALSRGASQQRVAGDEGQKSGQGWPLWLGLAAAVLLAIVLPPWLPTGTQPLSINGPMARSGPDPLPAPPRRHGSDSGLELDETEALLFASFLGDDASWSMDDEREQAAAEPGRLAADEELAWGDEEEEGHETLLFGAFETMNDQEAAELMLRLREEMAS